MHRMRQVPLLFWTSSVISQDKLSPAVLHHQARNLWVWLPSRLYTSSQVDIQGESRRGWNLYKIISQWRRLLRSRIRWLVQILRSSLRSRQQQSHRILHAQSLVPLLCHSSMMFRFQIIILWDLVQMLNLILQDRALTILLQKRKIRKDRLKSRLSSHRSLHPAIEASML